MSIETVAALSNLVFKRTAFKERDFECTVRQSWDIYQSALFLLLHYSTVLYNRTVDSS